MRHAVDLMRKELGQLQKQIGEKKKAGQECDDLIKQKVVIEGNIKREEKTEQFVAPLSE